MRTKATWVMTSILVILGLLMSVFGCAKPTPAPAGAPYKPPELMGMATGVTGTTTYAAMLAVTPTMEKAIGTSVRLMPSESVATFLQTARDGKAQVCSGYSVMSLSDGVMATAETVFANPDWGPQNPRIVWRGYDYNWSLMVRGDSSIKTVEDIKGKKIGYWSGVAVRMLTDGLLAWLGLTRNDLQFIDLGMQNAMPPSVVEGRADFTWAGPDAPVTIEAAQNPKGLRFISLPVENKEGWRRFMEKAPMVIPSVVTRGVKPAIGIGSAAVITPVVAYPDADPELTYRIAKYFAETYNDYKGLAPALADYSLEKMKEFLGQSPYAIDKGTIKYLTEKGVWTAKDDQWNKQWLDLEAKWRAAWNTATKEATAKNIKIDYKNPEWVKMWESYRQQLPAFRIRA